MIKRICGKCGSRKVADAGSYGGSPFFKCETCGQLGMSEKFPKMTVFQQITQSPEVLAEKSIYFRVSRDGEHYTYSSPWIDTVHETEAEAIAATVMRLKEVAE